MAAAVPCLPVQAKDDGRFSNSSPEIRRWFRDLRQPDSGISCCDVADGHEVDYRVRGGTYYVMIEGREYPVPPRKIVRNQGNPTGSGVVFYSMIGSRPLILCFIPDDVF
jgi:hypothetical protein